METHSIGVVVVIYNKKCTDSVSFRGIITNKTTPVILVDNSTDSDIQSYNREECHRIGCDYHSMDGNKGLAKAYNAAVTQIGSRIDYLMILDDDTIVPPDVISQINTSIAHHTSTDIFVPFVLDQSALLSPSRRWSSLFFRFKRRPESFTSSMSAINSGLVIRLDPGNREKPLFYDKMFLDCIDHDFILRKIRRGDSFALYPAEFHQNFFDGTSRGQASREQGRTSKDQDGTSRMQTERRQAALVRFELFAKDYLYFCRDCSLNMLIAHVYLFYRMTRLNMRFRTTDFGKALKRSKTKYSKAEE